MESTKTLKQYCKEAKKRLKNGFWQNYATELKKELEKAEDNGVNANKVKEYYVEKVINNINKEESEDEAFYKKVKTILDSEGEISNAIGRLTDKTYYETLSYEEKQRYTLSLSEKYLKAKERYVKEKELKIN